MSDAGSNKNSRPGGNDLDDGVDKKGKGDEVKRRFRFGPLPVVPNQRFLSRGILVAGIIVYMWFSANKGKEISLARQKEHLSIRGQSVDCDNSYLKEIRSFPGCVPKNCGRFVSDILITPNQVTTLLNIAKRGFSLSKSLGGASILDLHSGALSYNDKFINLYALDPPSEILSHADMIVYKTVRLKIQSAIAENFGIDTNSLFLTHPTFFSKLNNLDPKTPHDEYWHVHVDKILPTGEYNCVYVQDTYETFHYTSLVYLADFKIDFKGGRFIFVDDVKQQLKNTTIEPKKGRVLMFTSGGENPHFVERVTSGERFAITVSFTCNSSMHIMDPIP